MKNVIDCESLVSKLFVTMIGIIDTEINHLNTFEFVNKNVLISDGSIYVIDKTINNSSLTHGDICTAIIHKYSKRALLNGINILNQKGVGNVNDVGAALEWCLSKSLDIINFSLGTTHFFDKYYIRKTINHYANKGLSIIAATSNDGYTTYPASLSNVISVATGDRFGIDQDMQFQKGIDFIAPSDHEITIEGASFCLGKSNSYAAPYVTAMVGNLIAEKGRMTIDEIRKRLAPEGTTFIYSPDWIEKAWISPEYRRIDVEFYFDADERDLQKCIDDIDTLVLCTHSEMERYGDLDKHIVYLGNDAKRATNSRRHFWNTEMRREQIMLSKEKDGIIDVPIICFVFNRETEIIRILCEMKKLFADDGYNAFIGCEYVDSPLYDLEYLPNNIVLKKKMEDFIYWQTNFQQSDLIVIGYVFGDEGIFGEANPDMVVRFNHMDDCIRVEISIDGQMSIENEYLSTERYIVGEVYHNIISNFEKKEDE